MATPFGRTIMPMLGLMEERVKTEINQTGGHWSLNTGDTMPIFSNQVNNNQINNNNQENQSIEKPVPQLETILQRHREFNGVHIVINPKPIIATQASVNPIINMILKFQLSNEEIRIIENIKENFNQNLIPYSSDSEIELIVNLSKNKKEEDVFAPLYILRLFLLEPFFLYQKFLQTTVKR